MWLRIVAVLLICFCSFGDCARPSRVRTKRQDAPINDQNIAIEFFNNCTCVTYYLCDEDGYIITDGKTLIEFKLGQSKQKRIKCIGGATEGVFVCCKFRPGHKGTTVVATKQPLTATKNTTEMPTSTVPAKRSCGRQLPNVDVRIFHDENELTPVDGEFPWLAAIFKKEDGTWKFHASGSIIHSRVILTSNHVVVSAKVDDLKIIANGEIKLGQIGKNPLQERNVKEIIKHPDYNSGMLLNDVALLLLEEPYNISVRSPINSLCLKPNISYEGKRCLVAGWGRTANEDGTAKVLKKVELPTHSRSRCQEMLGKALSKSNYEFHESLMCAGGELGRDACKGDGGSPLMCPTGANNTMYQVGIVAWGIGCGHKDVPGAYANVEYLHGWIVNQLKQKGIEI